MSQKVLFSILIVLLISFMISSCTTQERIVSSKSPPLSSPTEDTVLVPISEEGSPVPNNSPENQTGQQATVFPTGNADETELIRQKRYSTLLDFTDLRFENCPKIESELLLQLDNVRDNMENVEQGIDDAYDKILEERAKDEQLSQQGATPSQLSRQKGYVKEAEQLHTKRLLERDEAKRLEEQLVSTINKLHDECVKAEIRERKEAIDAERS